MRETTMQGADPRATMLILLFAAGAGACTHRERQRGADTGDVLAAREVFFTSFEDTAPGSLPAGWRPVETNGRGTPAAWRVEKGAGPDGGGRVLRLAETRNSGSTFNVLLLPRRFPPDLVLRVALRADGGREDQGGGLVWRARDAENYYVARWNPLEDNLRAYEVVGGRRTMLRSARLTADPGSWHTLEVEARGRRILVRFDGEEKLALEDDTFADGGLVGLWTKADAATTFDDLQVRGLERR